MKSKYVYPTSVHEHMSDDHTIMGTATKPCTIWRLVPRICGNCPLAYESTKCKRTSCRVKSLERRGIPAVY